MTTYSSLSRAEMVRLADKEANEQITAIALIEITAYKIEFTEATRL